MSTPFNDKISAVHDQAQTKSSEMMKSTKDGAIAVHDKACDFSQSAKESGQEGQKNATGFIQQTGTNLTNMATGAVESVKNTLGMNEKPIAAPVQNDQPGFVQQTGAAVTGAVDGAKNALGMNTKPAATTSVERTPQNPPGIMQQTGTGVMNAANSAVDAVKNTLGMNEPKK